MAILLQLMQKSRINSLKKSFFLSEMCRLLEMDRWTSKHQSKIDREQYLGQRALDRKTTGHKKPNMRKYWERQRLLDVKLGNS